MRKKKRGNLLMQIMRPLVLFIIVLILNNGIFIFIYNLNRNINERYVSANLLGRSVASNVESYKSLKFLTDYWREHSTEMHFYYDEEDQLIAREKLLYSVLPNISSITQVTDAQARNLTPLNQKLFAEVCYSRLCQEFDSFKRSYQSRFLYACRIEDGQTIFMITGTLENEKRTSQGGDIFELGYSVPYKEGAYPVLDEVLKTHKMPDKMELSMGDSADNSSVHTFVPIYADGEMVMVLSVSLEWTDIMISAARPAIVITCATAVLFAFLGLTIYLLIRKTVSTPVNREQAIIKNYETYKDSEFAVESLSKIVTDNEIQSLAEGFSSMVEEIDRYIKEVRHATKEREKIKAELSMAAAIQESQLPRVFPAFPERDDFDVYASMTPAKEVGGDFYDFFLIDENHLGLIIADVSGKGIPAALFMMVSKILIKNHLMRGESLSEALGRVNNQLMENNEAELFVTVWAAVIDLSTGKGTAANAGHEHPIIRRADGEYEFIQYRHSPPIATYPDLKFKEHGFELHPGDSLFVYTDGLPEATNSSSELFGGDRMLNALNRKPDATPEILLNIVISSVNEFVGEAEQFDDLTMLSIRYNGPADKPDTGSLIGSDDDDKPDEQ